MTAGTMVARKQTAARAPRGAIAKRRTALRSDKDGDLVMGGPSTRGRGGISKSTPPTGPAGEVSGRKPRSTVNAGRLKSEISRHVSSGSVPVKSAGRTAGHSRAYEEIEITGWANSKASTTSEDGGVSSLISWLERKATIKNPSKRPVRVKKKHSDADTIIVSAPSEHVQNILRLNGFEFAGKSIKVRQIEDGDGKGPESETTKNTIAMLRGVLERRYNPEMKLLDLSALAKDPDLTASAIFDSSSTTSKFFPALMKVLDQQFEKPSLKHEAIQSVTLADNGLHNLNAVTTLSQTLPQLKNLDLSNNNFTKISDIEVWRKRFSKLDQLVISRNPLEVNERDIVKILVSWYPRLRMLNNIQVRTDEEAAKAFQVTDLPFPVRTAVFQDEGHIAENFVRTFFTGYDVDRATLARLYYDDKSDFSFAVNTAAPRDPNATEESHGPQDWETYIKQSRNLKKITHLPSRLTRLSKGVNSVVETWASLPVTHHPDLAAEAKKWLIECQAQPGLPDPTGQSVGGVDGFLITVHGEFDEIDVSTNQAKKKRSFDRTFIIGPGGPSGVRVINDMLTIRAYGGSQAFEPADEGEPAPPQQQQQQTNGVHPSLEPALPTGLTAELAEQMVLELQKQTSMTVAYAKDCLEQVSWDFDRALQAFAAVRANLPPDAFVQGQAPA